MKVPFHIAFITDDEITEVVDSIRSGWLTTGPKSTKFENEFNKYIGSKYSIAVNSCTSALHLALKAINLCAGDEVIIPTMTFTATGEVICYFNAKPVLVDVQKDTHNIDVSKIEQYITSKTRAIIPVHYAGQPCDMDEILSLAEKYKLFVINDAAHALPAWYKNIKIGNNIGDLTCFSFYATKTLTTGEGGMITTENENWASRIHTLRLHGMSKDAWKRYDGGGSWHYEVIEAGFKYNFTDIQAGFGIAQLKKLEWMWSKRKNIAEKYNNAFKNSDTILTPPIKPDRISAWHLYVIKVLVENLTIDRAAFIEELHERGVGTSVHFIPLHRHPFYQKTFSYDMKEFTESDWIYERIISLPIYPGMTENDINLVIESVLEIENKFKR